jgi:aspartate racemase
MKRIGLIGGMSWESSAEYYRLLNQRINSILGGSHSCECILDSVDFDRVERLQHDEKWEDLCTMMKEKAQNLAKSGAELVLLCTNTMHVCEHEISKDLTVPFLHIADATGQEIVSKGLNKVGLLGTRFTMEKQFYTSILKEKYQVDVIVPEKADRDLVHTCIYEELVRGEFLPASRREFVRVIQGLHRKGAQGVILGCTEIPMLVKQNDVKIPVFDTTALHVDAAVKMALKD